MFSVLQLFWVKPFVRAKPKYFNIMLNPGQMSYNVYKYALIVWELHSSTIIEFNNTQRPSIS